MLTFLDDVIAMVLSYVILREGIFLNPVLGFGICLAVGSAILLAFERHRNKEPMIFFVYVAFYSVIWGIAYFSQRYFAFGGFSAANYLLGWYGGSLLSAAALRIFFKESLGDCKEKTIGNKGLAVIAIMSLCIFLCVYIALNVLRQMPQIAFQPVLLVSEAVIPTMLGLIVFKEHKQFSRFGWAVVICALAGVFLIAIGF